MAESQANELTSNTPHLAIESLGYKGVELNFMGVNHNMVTFEAYRERFEKEISKSNAVLLEGAPRAEGLIDDKGQFTDEAVRSYQQVHKLSTQEIKSRLERLRGVVDFFANIERSAGSQGKDIMIFDPFSMDPNKVSSRQQLQLADMNLGLKMTALTTLSGTAATVGGFFTAKDVFKKKHSRRAALAGIGASLSAVVTGSALLAKPFEHQRIATAESLNNPNPLTFSLMDFIDYRNAAIAYTFTALADQGRLDSKIAGIYGDGHRAQIRYYLEHPTQRDLKLSSVYGSMIEVAPPAYKRFSRQSGIWTKTVDQTLRP